MISDSVRAQLHDIGIFLSNDKAARHKDEFNPFFTIEPDSVEPTSEELGLLKTLTEEYRTSRFTPEQIRDCFWGKIANTIYLWKREDGWRYSRMTWETRAWAPKAGQVIEDLFDSAFR